MVKQPHLNSNFLVDLGNGDSIHPEAGFCEVIFPAFKTDSTAHWATNQPDQSSEQSRTSASPHLILRRGVTASLDLYVWWDLARHGNAPKQRTVKIHLLAADHSSIVLTWLFRHARPVSLSYSPLNALQGSVQIESIELDFDSVEMANA